ncbi:hypothetical protein AVEN_191472-1 [Araneus ventricosus]|uniref:Uncharacterized protein n=1 Tax=Araneus ventricosus TaxID=182803 RepID=A0A4Y2T2M9_ARAVE|nr:hypothetical protein AVEN_191472-1 [Araneus ventricosus]
MPRKRKSNLARSSCVARAMKVARKLESDVQDEARKRDQADRQTAFRAAETPEHSQARRTKDTERHASVRAAETPDESQRRRDVNNKRQSEQRCAFTYNIRTVFNDAAFNYDPLIDCANQRFVMIGKMDKKSVQWEKETAGMCCSGGKVSLPLLGEPEEPLKSLLLCDLEESRRYLNRIRRYNTCFQMMSFGVGREVVMPV